MHPCAAHRTRRYVLALAKGTKRIDALAPGENDSNSLAPQRFFALSFSPTDFTIACSLSVAVLGVVGVALRFEVFATVFVLEKNIGTVGTNNSASAARPSGLIALTLGIAATIFGTSRAGSTVCTRVSGQVKYAVHVRSPKCGITRFMGLAYCARCWLSAHFA